MTDKKLTHTITFYSLKDLGKNTLTREECTGDHPMCLQHGDERPSKYPKVGRVPKRDE